MTDEVLATRIKEKDEDAFCEIYYRYNRLVFQVILQIVKDSEIARELTQDTFLKIYEKIDQYDGKSFKYWIIQIAKNIAKNHYTRVMSKDKKIVYNETIVENRVVRSHNLYEEFDQLLKENFTPDVQEIIFYKIIYNSTFKEIALITGSQIGVVYKKYKQALPTLKKIIKEMKE